MTASNPVVIDLRVPRTLEAPGIARRTAEAVRGKLDPRLYQDATLVISELVSNSVLHAGIDPTAQVEAKLTLDDEVVRLEVADTGPGMNGVSRTPPRADEEQGRGLGIVNSVADRWGIAEDAMTRVWVELDRS